MGKAALEDEQRSKAGQENDYEADQMDLTTREVRLGDGGGGWTHQEPTNILGNPDQSMAGGWHNRQQLETREIQTRVWQEGSKTEGQRLAWWRLTSRTGISCTDGGEPGASNHPAEYSTRQGAGRSGTGGELTDSITDHTNLWINKQSIIQASRNIQGHTLKSNHKHYRQFEGLLVEVVEGKQELINLKEAIWKCSTVCSIYKQNQMHTMNSQDSNVVNNFNWASSALLFIPPVCLHYNIKYTVCCANTFDPATSQQQKSHCAY